MTPESDRAYWAGIEYAWSFECDLESGIHQVPAEFEAHRSAYLHGVRVGIEQSFAHDCGAMAGEDSDPVPGQDRVGIPFALGCELLHALYEEGWKSGVTLALITGTVH